MSEVQLPEGWVWKKLGEVCKTTSGGTPSRTNSDYYTGAIPWVKSGELKNGVIRDTEEHVSEEAIKNSSAKIFPAGTLLIALYGATVGRLAFLGVEAATNQAICGITPGRSVDTNYLYWLLFYKRPQLLDERAGGAQPNISQNILRELILPLPPLPVQQQIVARIDELFSELDAGVKELKTALARLKTYRQAVLHHFLNNPDWERVKIGEIIKTINNGYTPKADKMTDGTGEVQFLKVYNLMFDGRLNHQKNPVFISLETHQKELKRSITYPNDVLVNIVGPPLGKVSLVPPVADQFNINQAVVLFRPNEKVLPKFLSYYLQEPKTIRWLEATSKATAGQYNVKVSTCREIPFPIVDLTTQNQIVSQIEARLSEADAMETAIRQELVRSENLRQSILKQAFSGKLVTPPVTPISAEELAEVSEPVSPFYGSPSGDQLTLF